MTQSEFKQILWGVFLFWLAQRYVFPILDGTVGKYLPRSA